MELNVTKVTSVDNSKGLIPMSNNMVEQALISTNGVCVDDNNNPVCQVYKITIHNTGTNSTFVDGYVTLIGGTGNPVDYMDYAYNTSKTTMRWAQAFCSEETNGIVTSCTTAGNSTARTDDTISFQALGGEETMDDYLNTSQIYVTKHSVTSSKTINGNHYDVINKNYIRISDHTINSNVYNQGGDVTSALVYNQYLAPDDNNSTNNTGTSSSTYTDSQVYYIIVWLSETGTNQTIGASNNPTSADNLFSGIVTFESANGSNTAKFGNYSSGEEGGNNSAVKYIKNLYNDGSELTAVNIGGNELYPSVSLNSEQGIMLDNNGEYRFYGANPNNYVRFNDELWRIISVSNVKSGTSDQTGTLRMKLIRYASIGSLSWDSSASGNGVNDWSQADLKTTLNGIYYNRDQGTCYTGGSNATTACSFATIGLSSAARDKIDTALYYLGAGTNGYPYATYNSERSTSVYNCSTNDGSCPRATTWEGIVGLMYNSDYGYAADLSLCTKTLGGYSDAACTANNWLYYNTSNQWLLSPYSGSATDVFSVYSSGYVNNYYISASYSQAVRPVVYLRSDVEIVSGEGTSTSPYSLS